MEIVCDLGEVFMMQRVQGKITEANICQKSRFCR